MKYVVVDFNTPTINDVKMSYFLYGEKLKVLYEDKNVVVVRYNNEAECTYVFDKKHVREV